MRSIAHSAVFSTPTAARCFGDAPDAFGLARLGLSVILIGSILLAGVGCRPDTKTEAVTKPQGAIVELTTAQVEHAGFSTARVEDREASDTLRLPGTLAVDPRHSWRVSPVVEGVVEEVGAMAHDVVRKGQVLARLRSNALGEAQVAWLEARAGVRLATAERERSLALRKEGVVSESQWLRVDTDHQRAQAALAQAERKLALAGMSSEQIDALESPGRRLGEMALTSPANGVVLASTVARGQALGAGENAFEVADLSTLWVTVHIPVASLASVKLGAKATVRVSGSARAAWDGTVGSLGGKVDGADQTLEGRVVVSNEGGFLRPGMYAEVEVVGAPMKALMVPSAATFNVGNLTYVFHRLGTTRFEAVEVTSGAPLGEWTPVHGSGIQAGFEVVVGGLAELKSHWLYTKSE